MAAQGADPWLGWQCIKVYKARDIEVALLVRLPSREEGRQNYPSSLDKKPGGKNKKGRHKGIHRGAPVHILCAPGHRNEAQIRVERIR